MDADTAPVGVPPPTLFTRVDDAGREEVDEEVGTDGGSLTMRRADPTWSRRDEACADRILLPAAANGDCGRVRCRPAEPLLRRGAAAAGAAELAGAGLLVLPPGTLARCASFCRAWSIASLDLLAVRTAPLGWRATAAVRLRLRAIRAAAFCCFLGLFVFLRAFNAAAPRSRAFERSLYWLRIFILPVV